MTYFMSLFFGITFPPATTWHLSQPKTDKVFRPPFKVITVLVGVDIENIALDVLVVLVSFILKLQKAYIFIVPFLFR